MKGALQNFSARRPSVTPSPVIDNPWQQLRQFTTACIALGRCGVSLPTDPQLAFQLAHARARDAVHRLLDVQQLTLDLERLGVISDSNILQLDSQAADRLAYVQRPDLGRRLNDASRQLLVALAPNGPRAGAYDLAVVISDGLSAQAVAQNAAPFLAVLKPRLTAENWTVAPVAVVRLGRVAVADEVAFLLGSKLVVHLIGERPGLGSLDSMGVYATWAPQVGLVDAQRNCLSNIRSAGMSYETAAFKLHHLLLAMNRRQLSGIELKDESDTDALSNAAVLRQDDFLLARREPDCPSSSKA